MYSMKHKTKAYEALTKQEQHLVAELNNRGGFSYINEWFNSQKNEYPARPIKPRLSHDIGLLSSGAQIYLNACVAYDEQYEQYRIAFKKYNDKNIEIENALRFFVKDHAGLFDIPVIYQDSVWSKSWSDGHSSGWENVYNILCSHVEIFKLNK